MSRTDLEQVNEPGWIFLDKDQVDSFRRALDESEGEDTVDQLGFGPLAGEISNWLFPWCSTLTTRARYFLTSAAILDIALERIADRKSISVTGDAPTRLQLRDRSARYQAETMRLERILAISLYAHYVDASGTGIFGKRNLDQIKDRRLDTVLSKKLLSLPGRYPNAIYRGGLQELHLFARNQMSNTFAVQLALNDETPFSVDWQTASTQAKNDVERLEEFWTDKKRQASSLNDACIAFRDSSAGKAFHGFALNKVERVFLFGKLSKVSPFLMPLEKQPNKFLPTGGDLDLPTLAEAIGGDFKQTAFAAFYVNNLISPFRQMYRSIADRQEAKLKAQKFEYRKISAAYRKLQDSEAFSSTLPQVLEVTTDWVKELTCTKGRPNENLIQHLKDRAREIVSSRGKTAPHLVDPEKRKFGKSVTDELDIIIESTFRLGNASTILRDVLGVGDAG